MKKTIILLVITALMFSIAGCGPGEPFEIEGKHSPQNQTATHIAAAR